MDVLKQTGCVGAGVEKALIGDDDEDPYRRYIESPFDKTADPGRANLVQKEIHGKMAVLPDSKGHSQENHPDGAEADNFITPGKRPERDEGEVSQSHLQ